MKVVNGNIFTSECQTLVNTVNCVGVMGAGIALEFKFRYPDMFKRYVQLCDKRLIGIGMLWLYKAEESSKWVLNFPTKKNWKHPSKIEYLERGLSKFMETYSQKGIESAAFPVLGASNGGIPEPESLRVMESYLKDCTIPIDIYTYDPNAADDLYMRFKDTLLSKAIAELASDIGLRHDLIEKLLKAVENPEVNSISQLASQEGIGLVSLEKTFKFLCSEKSSNAGQRPLI